MVCAMSNTILRLGPSCQILSNLPSNSVKSRQRLPCQSPVKFPRAHTAPRAPSTVNRESSTRQSVANSRRKRTHTAPSSILRQVGAPAWPLSSTLADVIRMRAQPLVPPSGSTGPGTWAPATTDMDSHLYIRSDMQGDGALPRRGHSALPRPPAAAAAAHCAQHS